MQTVDVSSNLQPYATAARRARRPRAARACDLCRAKKNKCDEAMPCAYCRSRNVECLYQGQAVSDSSVSKKYVQQLEDQLRLLSMRLEVYEKANPSGTTDACIPYTANAVTQNDNNDEPPTPDSVSTWALREQEVSGVNSYTHNTEFYGSSSSMTHLSHIHGDDEQDQSHPGVLLSNLSNPSFRPVELHDRCEVDRASPHQRSYRQCRSFIDTYFTSIHYIHPILDKRTFLEGCESFWSGKGTENRRPTSFEALYFSVLSLGAIVGVRDDEPIDGIENLEWSRRFFRIAQTCCTQLGMLTDLSITQCYFVMAKVCQNELHPHIMYMYVGLAVRTALAMGINREPGSDTTKPPSVLKAEARLWWGLYSLETETSFAMGRPDTLGADLYHNRRFPITESAGPSDSRDIELLDNPHCAIIKCMVDLSRITRSICLRIYLPQVTLSTAVVMARKLEVQLEQWKTTLPEAIRPIDPSAQSISLTRSKDHQWMKRQRLVLTLRHHNLQILLFGAFLLNSTRDERKSVIGAREGIGKCLESAKQTIQLIHQTYQHSDFFRTWFYNVTYTVFAASTIFMYLRQEADVAEVPELIHLIDMAVEILAIMDESVVAQQVAKLLREAKLKFESEPQDPVVADVDRMSPGATACDTTNHWGSLNFFDGGLDPVFAASIVAFDLDNPALETYQQHSGLGSVWGT